MASGRSSVCGGWGVRGGFGAGVSAEGLKNAPGISGRMGKTWPSFTIEVDLDGPGTGVEGGSGEGHEAPRILFVPSCGGIAGVAGAEMKPPTILDVCGGGDGDENSTCGPEVIAERCGGESSEFGEPDRGGLPFNRILWGRPRRICGERRETRWGDTDLGRVTSVLRK